MASFAYLGRGVSKLAPRIPLPNAQSPNDPMTTARCPMTNAPMPSVSESISVPSANSGSPERRMGVLPGSTETWKLLPAFASTFHGEGCLKWCSSEGRELVLNSEGEFEDRIEFAGTFNFGNNPFDATNLGHRELDMLPYYDWGSGPGDVVPGRPSKRKQVSNIMLFGAGDVLDWLF
jgi:hypothetical protein